jgi:hypothetical protein
MSDKIAEKRKRLLAIANSSTKVSMLSKMRLIDPVDIVEILKMRSDIREEMEQMDYKG